MKEGSNIRLELKFGFIVTSAYFGLVALSFFLPAGGHPSPGALVLLALLYPSILLRLAPYFGLAGIEGMNLSTWSIVAVGMEYFILGAAIGAICQSCIRRRWDRSTSLGALVLVLFFVSFPFIASLTHIPWIAERYVGSSNYGLRRKAVLDLGESGSQKALNPLLGQLRTGELTGVDQAAVIALTKIGGVGLWLQLFDSDEGKRLRVRDWLDVLVALDIASRTNRLSINSIEDQQNLHLLEDKLAAFGSEQLSSGYSNSLNLLLAILWCNPSQREKYLELLFEHFCRDGSINQPIARFLFGIEERRYIADYEFCSTTEADVMASSKSVEQYVSDWRSRAVNLDLTVVLNGSYPGCCYYGSFWSGSTRCVEHFR